MRQLPIHPIVIMMFAIFVLTCMDVLLKIVGAHYSTFQLAWMRFAFGSCFAAATWLRMRPALPSREAVKVNALRGLIGAFTASTFFYALQTLQLAEAVAFSFLSPLFLVLFGIVLLGEKIGSRTILALIFGFGGMLIMVLGQGFTGRNLHLPGVAGAVASALGYALSLILLRQRAQQDALITIVLFQHIMPVLVLLAPAIAVWQPVRAGDLWMLTLLGMLGLAGHLVLAEAFKRAEASRLAPGEYSALIFAALLGFEFFGEVPGWITIFGSVLIAVGTGLAMQRKPAGEPKATPLP